MIGMIAGDVEAAVGVQAEEEDQEGVEVVLVEAEEEEEEDRLVALLVAKIKS